MMNIHAQFLKVLRLKSICRAIARSCFAIALASSLIGTGNAQMLMAGNLSVGKTGEATYTIPIEVVPGTAGIQPKLSFGYNSQDGNGLMGMGWGLYGLSSITRCSSTKAQDNAIGTINLDTNDRFCLDGKRLNVVSGNYGAVGSKYRTEIEEYSDIEAVGGVAGDPIWFQVRTKGGLTLQFGYDDANSHSRIESQNKTVARTWLLNKVKDKNNNYLTAQYIEDNINGQYYIDRIDYTGNSTVSPALTPSASIRMTYETRPDVTPLYLVGSIIRTNKRLKKLGVYDGNDVVREYRIDYEVGSATGRSRVVSITQCVSDNAAAQCLPATTFSWSDAALNFPAASVWSNSFINSPWGGTSNGGSEAGFPRLLNDANGDGKADIVAFGSAGVSGTLSTGNTFGASTTLSSNFGDNQWNVDTGRYPRDLADVNGDGRDDIVGFGSSEISVGLAKPGTGIGFNAKQNWSSEFLATSGNGSWDPDMAAQLAIWGTCGSNDAPCITGYQPDSEEKSPRQIMDVNGDGRADVVGFGGNNVYVALSTGTSFAAKTKWSSDFGYAETYYKACRTDEDHQQVCEQQVPQRLLADVNGDGLPDVVEVGKGGIYVGLSTGAAFGPRTLWSPNTVDYANWITRSDGSILDLKRSIRAADVNGDGLADIVVFTSDGTAVSLSTGKAFTARATWTPDFSQNSGDEEKVRPRVVVDMNGDGLADIVGFGSTGTWISYSTGANFKPAVMVSAQFGQDGFPGNSFTPRRIGDLNGDGLPDIVGFAPNGVWVSLAPGAPPDLLTAINTGPGQSYQFFYQSLAQADATYVKDTTSAYPAVDTQAPYRVVSKIRWSNGVGGISSKTYRYEGMKFSQDGRGNLGFRAVTERDEQTSIELTTSYRQDFPYTGLPSMVERRYVSGATSLLLGKSVNTYIASSAAAASNNNVAGKATRIFLTKNVQQAWDIVGDDSTLPLATLPTVTSDFTYDVWGNMLTSQMVTGNHSKQVTNTYYNDPANWLIGLTANSIITQTNSTGTIRRTEAFAYDPATGQMTSKGNEYAVGDVPADLDHSLFTTYSRDQYGNLISTTVATSAGTDLTWFDPRTSSIAYDAKGRFATTATNAMGHAETRTFKSKTGAVTSLIGPNGVATTWEFDDFGRKTAENRADGTRFEIGYGYCTALPAGVPACPTQATTFVYSQGFDKNYTMMTALTVSYFDRLGREIRTTGQSMTSGGTPKTTIVDTVYDAKGQLLKRSEAYFEGTNSSEIVWRKYAYDRLGRVKTEYHSVIGDDSDGKERIGFHYDGLTTVSTTSRDDNSDIIDPSAPETEVRTVVKNALGQEIEIIDSRGGKANFAYDPQGNLTETKVTALDANGVPASIVTSIVYDKLGNKIRMNDPDKGLWTYDLDPLGQVRRQTDAKGNVSNIYYDKLGRVILKQVVNGTSGAIERNDHWQYDVGAKGIGKINAAASVDAAGTTFAFKGYNYDDNGRLLWSSDYIDGGNTYYQVAEYDENTGRLKKITYPSGLSLEYEYTAQGELLKVKNGTTGLAYWTAEERRATGQWTQSLVGNSVRTIRGYSATRDVLESIVTTKSGVIGPTGVIQDLSYKWDNLGNLMSRKVDPLMGGYEEVFGYDELNRLKSSQIVGQAAVNIAYDGFGNMLSKSDKSDPGTQGYAYDMLSKPHAVRQVLKGSVTEQYQYDLNGNMTQGGDFSATFRTVSWTGFNQPLSIKRDNVELEFLYNGSQERIRQKNGLTKTKFYYGDSFGMNRSEREVTSLDVIWTDQILVEGDMVASIKTKESNFAQVVSYTHADHLGSIQAITDGITGTKIESLDYDAWGARRQGGLTAQNVQGQPDLGQRIAGIYTDRGFTGHEMLDDVGLIHMNGRIYDAQLSRFMAADNFVQDPADGQNYSRYSYVGNRPLTATDPSGWFFEGERDQTGREQREPAQNEKNSETKGAATGKAVGDTGIAKSHAGFYGSPEIGGWSFNQARGRIGWGTDTSYGEQNDKKGIYDRYKLEIKDPRRRGLVDDELNLEVDRGPNLLAEADRLRARFKLDKITLREADLSKRYGEATEAGTTLSFLSSPEAPRSIHLHATLWDGVIELNVRPGLDNISFQSGYLSRIDPALPETDPNKRQYGKGSLIRNIYHELGHPTRPDAKHTVGEMDPVVEYENRFSPGRPRLGYGDF